MGKSPDSLLYRKIKAFINRRLGPVYVSGRGMNYWQERIFHYLSVGVIFIGVFAYLFYTILFLSHQQIAFALYSTFLFFTIVLVVSIRPIPITFRIRWLLFQFFLTGGLLLFTHSQPLQAMLFFLSYSVLAITIAGSHAAIRSVFFNLLALVAGGFFWYYPWGLDLTPTLSLQSYISLSISFIILNVILLIPLFSLVHGLIFSINKETRYQKLLAAEQALLVRAKEKAAESDHLKTAFLSNMSHEIRTPMNAILGFSNLLSHPDISLREKEEFVELIKYNGKSLMTLVDDIIDISKIESGQFRIRNATCQLHPLLDKIHQNFSDDMLRRGISNIQFYLKKGIAEKNVQILADGPRLEKILSSLLSNAIKFTDKGFIEFGYKHASNQYLEFYVKDTGVGLPEGKEQEVFNRFYKGPTEQERLYGGTGIGLTIARYLVELMGGEIWLESRPMIGTTVTFTIPFQRVGVAPGNSPAIKMPTTINWEDKTFLVAEDEEDNFRFLEVALSLCKARLIWARDGAEAVEIFQKSQNIDLVLMDIKMPNMDGYQATHAIKAIKPGVPIIAQTAYSLSEEKEKSIKAGCDGYIAKPINYQDLLKLIQQSLLTMERPSA